jgi:hypothetical protein
MKLGTWDSNIPPEVPIFVHGTVTLEASLDLDWFIPSTKYCQELWSYSVTLNMAKALDFPG